MKLTFADPWPVLPGILVGVAVVVTILFAYRSLRGAVDARSRLKFLAARIALWRVDRVD